MSADAPTTNGQASARERLEETRVRLEEARATKEIALIERRTKWLRESNLLWDWTSGYQDLVDRLKTDGGLLLLSPSTAADRRYGSNWPFWRTWQEHALLRGSARILCTTSMMAQGAISGLTSYVIGEGMEPRAKAKEKDGAPLGLVAAVQDVLDHFSDVNLFCEYQQELFGRSMIDGDFGVRYFTEDDGKTLLRTVDAPQIMDDNRRPLEEGSYGVITEPGDVEHPIAFHVCYEGDPSKGEIVPVEEMEFIKINTPRQVKRGMPDFTYDVYDALKTTGRFLNNMAEGGAIQAAIALIREHEQAGPDAITTFANQEADYQQTNPWTGTQVNTRRIQSGTVYDIPKGFKYADTPYSQGAASWGQIVATVLQATAARWNAPVWLISGDASNNNYSSSITAESPFVKRCGRVQKFWQTRLTKMAWKSIYHFCRARGGVVVMGRKYAWEEIRRYVDLQMEPPTIETRNKLEEAQTNSIYIQSRVKSPQTVQQELGLDPEEEQVNIEEFDRLNGPQLPDLPDDHGGGL